MYKQKYNEYKRKYLLLKSANTQFGGYNMIQYKDKQEVLKGWYEIVQHGQQNCGIFLNKEKIGKIMKCEGGSPREETIKSVSELNSKGLNIFPVIHNIYWKPNDETYIEMEKFNGDLTSLLFEEYPKYVFEELNYKNDYLTMYNLMIPKTRGRLSLYLSDSMIEYINNRNVFQIKYKKLIMNLESVQSDMDKCKIFNLIDIFERNYQYIDNITKNMSNQFDEFDADDFFKAHSRPNMGYNGPNMGYSDFEDDDISMFLRKSNGSNSEKNNGQSGGAIDESVFTDDKFLEKVYDAYDNLYDLIVYVYEVFKKNYELDVIYTKYFDTGDVFKDKYVYIKKIKDVFYNIKDKIYFQLGYTKFTVNNYNDELKKIEESVKKYHENINIIKQLNITYDEYMTFMNKLSDGIKQILPNINNQIFVIKYNLYKNNYVYTDNKFDNYAYNYVNKDSSYLNINWHTNKIIDKYFHVKVIDWDSGFFKFSDTDKKYKEEHILRDYNNILSFSKFGQYSINIIGNKLIDINILNKLRGHGLSNDIVNIITNDYYLYKDEDFKPEYTGTIEEIYNKISQNK